MTKLRLSGASRWRAVGRSDAAPLTFHAPPRTTFERPLVGPLGSNWASGVYGAYQSLVHSQTLPARSFSP